MNKTLIYNQKEPEEASPHPTLPHLYQEVYIEELIYKYVTSKAIQKLHSPTYIITHIHTLKSHIQNMSKLHELIIKTILRSHKTFTSPSTIQYIHAMFTTTLPHEHSQTSYFSEHRRSKERARTLVIRCYLTNSYIKGQGLDQSQHIVLFFDNWTRVNIYSNRRIPINNIKKSTQ